MKKCNVQVRKNLKTTKTELGPESFVMLWSDLLLFYKIWNCILQEARVMGLHKLFLNLKRQVRIIVLKPYVL